MKQSLLFLFFFTAFGLSAQISYSPEFPSGLMSADDEEIIIDVEITNNGMEASESFWVIDRSTAPEEWEFQLCDKNTCYIWGLEACPPSNPNVIEPDETSVYMMHFRPHEIAGEAEVMLNITDADGNVLAGVPITITVSEISSSENFEEEMDLRLFPNPTVDRFNIANDADVARVSFFNIVGKKIDAAVHYEGKSHDVSHLQKGIYMVRLFDERENVLSVFRLNKN